MGGTGESGTAVTKLPGLSHCVIIISIYDRDGMAIDGLVFW